MLQIPDDRWRRPRDDPPEIARQNVANFLKSWEPFDWTTQVFVNNLFKLKFELIYIYICTVGWW